MTKNIKQIVLSIKEAKLILESLEELSIDEEDFQWGPTYEIAEKKQDEAISILKKLLGYENN